MSEAIKQPQAPVQVPVQAPVQELVPEPPTQVPTLTPTLAPAPVDAGKSFIQELLGLSAVGQQVKTIMVSEEVKAMFSESVGSGIKSVLADADYLKLVVSIVSDSFFSLLKTASDDEEDHLVDIGARIMSDDRVKEALSDSVFIGTKRLVSDGPAQQGLAKIGNLIAASQEVSNTISRAIDTAARRQREFFNSKEFKALLKGVADDAVASAQETFNVSIEEAVEEIKKIELKGSFTAG